MDVEDGIAFAREAAAEGIVLLENRGELPWDAATLTSVAVIGNNAEHARTQGGGSATVLPETHRLPARGAHRRAARGRRSATRSARSTRSAWPASRASG